MKMIAVLALVLCATLAHAEDDDVYDGPQRGQAAPKPKSKAKDNYIVLAAGVTDFSWFNGTTVNVGSWRDPDPDVTRDTALSRCRSKGYPELEEKCEVVKTIHSGCIFYTKGVAPWGTAGYGIGKTPQEAYDNCEAKNLNCDVRPTGGCTNPELKPKYPDIVTVPNMRTYYALAVGIAYGKKENSLSMSAIPHLSMEQAKAWALTSCNVANSVSNDSCQIVKTFEHGCGWVSSGWLQNRSIAQYLFGATKQEALDACLATGANCDEEHTRGGCVDEP